MRASQIRFRSLLDHTAGFTGVLRMVETKMNRGLTILMYHRVLRYPQCPSYPLASLVVPDEAFRCQMQYLAEHCLVLPVTQALARLSQQSRHPRPLVAVTFDDGYDDNFEIAAPILEEFGIRGTFFVTSGFVDSGQPLWHDLAANAWINLTADNRALVVQGLEVVPSQGMPYTHGSNNPLQTMPQWMEALKRSTPVRRRKAVEAACQLVGNSIDRSAYAPMSIAQLQSLHQRGHEIGAHSITHPLLPQLDADTLQGELAEAREQLQSWTNDPVTGFCYPNGDYDNWIMQAVSQAGYDYACTTRSGLNLPNQNRLALNRLSITMHRTLKPDGSPDPLGFRAELCGFRQLLRR